LFFGFHVSTNSHVKAGLILLQRVHVWVAGEGKSIHMWGLVWGGAVTDGLKFGGGEASSTRFIETRIVRSMAEGPGGEFVS